MVESDAAVVEELTVERNDLIARDTYKLRFRSEKLATTIAPGQFVMLRAARRSDPLLARPFALYDTVDGPTGPEYVDIVYLVMGEGTKTLSRLRDGDAITVWGPLGNSFPSEWNEADHVVMVAGGIGQTPFLAVTRELSGQRTYGRGRHVKPPGNLSFLYGVRTGDLFAGLDDFRLAGVEPRLATDDGSAGRKGFVTDILNELFASKNPPTAILTCGPEPMLERVAHLADMQKIPCWVSMETKMACGYGVCFSCVAPIGNEADWDYRRVCLEGPIFQADKICWSKL